MATTRTSSAGKALSDSWESEKREHPQGAPFFARSPARGDFAARKGCFCPCTVQGASQRGHSLSQKRMAPLEPQEKGIRIVSEQLEELQCLPIALPIARRSRVGLCYTTWLAPTIRCRFACLVVVQPNFRLPRHPSMRRAQQCRYFARSLPPMRTSLAPHDSKARLIVATTRRRFMAKPCTPHPHCAARAVLQAANC